MGLMGFMQKQITKGIFDLFEWAFQVRFEKADRAAFTEELMREWDDGDTSEQMLAMELIQTRNQLMAMDPMTREAFRPQIVATLGNLMAQPRADDCGRVLHLLATTLERLQGRPAYSPSFGTLSDQQRAAIAAEHAQVSSTYAAVAQSGWTQNQQWVQSSALDAMRAINGGSGASYPGQW